MEARKRLYKAGPRDNPTLTERIVKSKNQRFAARNDKFNSNRQISIEDSPGTPPTRKPLVKVSEITNRRDQLQQFRIQKNAQKIKEVQEQKSPFIAVVPVGRWVEKKEKVAPPRFNFNDTPVKTALMNERVLKKSTIKKLISQGTSKKENQPAPSKSTAKPSKSKKNILGAFNSLPASLDEKDDELFTPLEPVDLNSTFEISPEAASNANLPEVEPPKAQKRRSKSDSSVPKKPKVQMKVAKPRTPPTKSAVKKFVAKPAPRAVIKKPVLLRKPAAAVIMKPVVRKEAPVKPPQIQKLAPAPQKPSLFVKSLEQKPVARKNPEADLPVPEIPSPQPAPAVKSKRKQEAPHSTTYNLYKTSLDTQIRYLSMQLQEIETNKPIFFRVLLDDEQIQMNKTIQQTNIIISDKLGKFGELLEQFETDQANPEARKCLTEDDVENYWYLIYDEIEKLKEELKKSQEAMKAAMRVIASAKRRRTRKNYVPDEGTPKRSRRIADNAETPKEHDCYGCVTMSASKVNTPRSNSKRRSTIKKSVLFEAETPKRADSGRRSSKRHKATPKRNLMRMDAVEIEEESVVDLM